nr:MAG TPA: ASCH domain protein [Caudoviricetes sp.]
MQKIMFNDRYELTDLVLSGKKTQTRRIVPKEVFTLDWDIRENYENGTLELVIADSFGNYHNVIDTVYNKYKNNEVVAVAMSYKSIYERVAKTWEYAEEYKRKHENLAGWNNKMFTNTKMPFAQIKITNIRIERLQDISDEDCMREGIYEDGDDSSGLYVVPFYDFWGNKCDGFDNPKEAFAALIDKINGKGTWDSNPYVFVYDFELAK